MLSVRLIMKSGCENKNTPNKTIYWINKIGAHGWPTAYIVD